MFPFFSHILSDFRLFIEFSNLYSVFKALFYFLVSSQTHIPFFKAFIYSQMIPKLISTLRFFSMYLILHLYMVLPHCSLLLSLISSQDEPLFTFPDILLLCILRYIAQSVTCLQLPLVQERDSRYFPFIKTLPK